MPVDNAKLCLTILAMTVIGQLSAINFLPAEAEDHSSSKHKVQPTGYQPASESPQSLEGKKLFAKNHCLQCHSVQSSGACLGPVLAGVGGRRSKEFLLNRITAGPKHEQAFAREYGMELMPHPRVAEHVATDLVSYLMTLPEPKEGFLLSGHKQEQTGKEETKEEKPGVAAIQNGKKLFYTKGCMSCHSIGKVGGQFAPPLDDVASKGRSHIRKQMAGAEMLRLGVGGEYEEKGTEMPPSNLSKSQIESITDFLMSLPQKS